MTDAEQLAVAYCLGHDYARKQLEAGKDADSIRLAINHAQEHLMALRAYSQPIDEMKRRGVEDALAGKPIDRRYGTPGTRS
jgi:hypothetical protein